MNSTRSGLSRTALSIRPSGVRVNAYIAAVQMKRVDREQVVDLDLRPEGDAQERLADGPVGRDAALAAEELGNHQRHRRHQLADAERDHRERRARLLGRHVAEDDGEEHAGEAADERDQAHRDRHAAVADAEQRVHGDEGAEPGVDRVAEAQHAALAEQHVVREAGDDRDADLRQHRDAEAAREDERRDREHERERRPRRRRGRWQARARGAAAAGGDVASISPPACRAGPWAGRSGSARAAGTAGSARPARSSASAASCRTAARERDAEPRTALASE